MDCEDQGKVSKTVSYRKITDCDVTEPAGKSGPCCCMVKNTLSRVNVDTASSGGTDAQGNRIYELSIVGLKDPVAFKKDVWERIREDGGRGGGTAVAAAYPMERGGGKGVVERMEEIQTLKDKGLITEKEFQEKRRAILNDA